MFASAANCHSPRREKLKFAVISAQCRPAWPPRTHIIIIRVCYLEHPTLSAELFFYLITLCSWIITWCIHSLKSYKKLCIKQHIGFLARYLYFSFRCVKIFLELQGSFGSKIKLLLSVSASDSPGSVAPCVNWEGWNTVIRAYLRVQQECLHIDRSQ